MAKKKTHKKKRKTGITAMVKKAVCGKKKTHKRRKNPGKISLRGLAGGMPSGKTMVGVALGALLVSASTKALAQGTPLFAGSGPSSTFGEPWNAKQYAAAGAIALIGPKIAEKVVRGSGQAVGITALVLLIGKTVMPLIGKTPLARYLGDAEGDIRVDDDGQTWILQNGQWQAMQGLVDVTPMDAIYERDALDGLVESSPMDAVDDDYGNSTSMISVN